MVFVQRGSLSDSIPQPSQVNTDGQENNEDNPNSTWELLNNLDVPIRESHNGQTLKALLKIRSINMIRDPMAVFFQVIMPVLFAALGIWLGTLATERSVEVKRSFTFGQFPTVFSISKYFKSFSDSNYRLVW